MRMNLNKKQKFEKKLVNGFFEFFNTFFDFIFHSFCFVLIFSSSFFTFNLSLNLKKISNLSSMNIKKRNPNITIQTYDGTVIATYGDLCHEFIRARDLPPHIINAFISVEDKRFFTHSGIDPIGIFRAFLRNYKSKKIVEGGSTITQQLAKNILISEGKYFINERTYERKMNEIFLALKLESIFSKEEIISLYLNRIYFGAGTYGIEAASKRFFDKSAVELTIFESAILAGLVKAPSRFSPISNPKEAIERAVKVLERMEINKFIQNDWKKNLNEWENEFKKLKIEVDESNLFFADWINESIPELIGPIDEDLIVVTTLDLKMQKIAEDVLKEYYEKFSNEYKFSQYSFLLANANGAVRVMVGGRDYSLNQFNRTVRSKRQMGSSFKLFVYLAAIESGIMPDDLIDDSPFSFNGWSPSNFKWKSKGKISVNEGFTKSVNSVAARLGQFVGIKKIKSVARRLGIKSEIENNLTIVLGTPSVTLIEMLQAYGSFAASGYAIKPFGIIEIRNTNGEIIYQYEEEELKKIIKNEHLEMMIEMMKNTVQNGTARGANVDNDLFGKTGSNGDRDAYFFVCRKPKNLLEPEIISKEIDYSSLPEYGYIEPKNDELLINEKNSLNKFDFISVENLGPRESIDQNGLVAAIWIGNDYSEKKMAHYSVGGKLPCQIFASFFKKLN